MSRWCAKKVKELPMQQTIFFGNGINRLSNAEFEWSNFLSSVIEDKKHDFKGIANTHAYESMLIHRCSKPKGCACDILKKEEHDVKVRLAQKLRDTHLSEEAQEIYEKLCSLTVKHILTTNYDNKFIELAEQKGYILDDSKRDISEHIFSLHRKYDLCKDYSEKYLWPIHGDINKEPSMMLGYDHYCASIGAISKYINKGDKIYPHLDKYKIRREKESHNDYLPYILYRVKHGNGDIVCWIDTFFMTDVHILGFGMDFSEIDFWWILNKRARLMQSYWNKDKHYPIKIRNKIYVYGHIDSTAKLNLLNSYGVNTENATSNIPSDWGQSYLQAIEQIQKNIDNSSHSKH